ncbi:MAG: carboxypeptidase regulatory-like domain-containing protein [Burkholderiales bacterium]
MHIGIRRGAALLAAGLAAAFAGAASAGTLSGHVKDEQGRPVVGAMVSVADGTRGMAESVFTGRTGGYTLRTGLWGNLKLRVRKAYYADASRDVTVANSESITVDVALSALKTDQEISDALPSLSHFSRIAFDAEGPFSRAKFARDCLSCHAIGNSFTRTPRPPEGWLPTVQRMHGYIGNGDAKAMQRRAELLSAGLDGKPVTSRPVFPIDPELYKARILQYRLDGAGVPHDAEYSHRDGKVYTVDMFVDQIIVTDLKTGRHEKHPETADGLPPGGAFTKMGAPAPYGLTISRAPHSLAEGADGKWYLTESIGGSIGAFDPVKKTYEHFDVGNGAVYPHSVRVDRKGIVWFTIAFSNQMGRLDPVSKEMKVINLPATPSMGAACCPVPYGIDVSPVDGSVWYTKLFGDRIGRIDAQSLEVTEIDSPVEGPRRHRFDKAGNLWIAGFSHGEIARLDTRTMKSRVFALPVFAPGEIPSPYALAVHPDTQEIWVNDVNTDHAYRFIPGEERFVAYPMPLRGTYTRDFTFTKEGWACSANNPIPAAALEGYTPELICIDTGRRG